MQEHWAKLKTKWANLTAREQQVVAVGAIFVGIFSIYQCLWSPLVEHVAAMRERIVTQQKLLVWMQAADKQIHEIEGQTKTKQQSHSPVMLLSLVQKQINHAGLDSQLTQLKQITADGIELHFQKIEFDKFIVWLTTLVKEQQLTLAQLSTHAQATSGIVDVDLILKIK